MSERYPRVRDRAIFVGNPDDIVPGAFGADLPGIRPGPRRTLLQRLRYRQHPLRSATAPRCVSVSVSRAEKKSASPLSAAQVWATIC